MGLAVEARRSPHDVNACGQLRGYLLLGRHTGVTGVGAASESVAVTEPLTVALDELRAAAADLHAIAIRLRADVAAFEYASIGDGWRSSEATRVCGITVATRLNAVIRDLEQDRAALDEAATAYIAADDRATLRLPGRAMQPW